MIDHIGITVTDLEQSKRFYSQALSAIGFTLLAEVPKALTGTTNFVGFGVAPKPELWLSDGPQQKPHVHVAFRAETRAQVDAFYQKALEVGGRDNGAPGIRAHYHENYYGAFVLDPDGHNIEVVCHKPS